MSVAVPALRYQDVRDTILEWVSSGRFSAGDRLPPERVLAERFKVNHRTVRRALAELVEEDILVKRPRAGCFVREIRSRVVLPQVAVALPVAFRDIVAWDAGAAEPLGGQAGTGLLSAGVHPLLGLMTTGMSQALDQRDYGISTLFFHPARLWADLGAIILDRKIQGLILWASTEIARRDVELLLKKGVRLVLFGPVPPQLEGLGLVAVDLDYLNGITQVTRRLIELGHREILFCTYRRCRQRPQIAAALKPILAEAGLGPFESMCLEIPNDAERSDYRPLEEVFRRQSCPTAMLMPDDFTTYEVFRLCYRRHWWIPEKLSLVTMSNVVPRAFPVPMAGFDLREPWVQSTKIAAEVMTRLIRGEVVEEGVRLVEVPLQWGESIDVPSRSSSA